MALKIYNRTSGRKFRLLDFFSYKVFFGFFRCNYQNPHDLNQCIWVQLVPRTHKNVWWSRVAGCSSRNTRHWGPTQCSRSASCCADQITTRWSWTAGRGGHKWNQLIILLFWYNFILSQVYVEVNENVAACSQAAIEPVSIDDWEILVNQCYLYS